MKPRLVLVGNGMAGVFAIEQILKHSQDFAITIFGEEPMSTTTGFFSPAYSPVKRN